MVCLSGVSNTKGGSLKRDALFFFSTAVRPHNCSTTAHGVPKHSGSATDYGFASQARKTMSSADFIPCAFGSGMIPADYRPPGPLQPRSLRGYWCLIGMTTVSSI